ncbi:hypothetical protein PG996_000821 [Apiospora saccharicola]|uniref:F-box domain-containing protein n=1 Tax=Apiospora saccharicola TaxID=335842 RepID=A0ABR1WHT0_9PEZI
MAQLQHIPTEILIQILQYVRQVDFRAFFFSQATSRIFRSIVQDMITSVNKSSSSSTIRQQQERFCLHPFLQTRFAPLFNTSDAFTADERARNVYYYLSLEGDCTLPFRRLQWAQSEAEREVYLRAEASWRRLPLLGDGGPITQLEIVKNYTTQTSDTVEYLQVELTPPSSSSSASAGQQQLTMGTFFDLLLSKQATYQWETGSWELHLGTRLRNVDLLYEYECYVPTDPDLLDFDAPHCAVLNVLGGTGCDQEFLGVNWETCWRPRILGENPPRCLPWQGPLKQRDEEIDDEHDDENDE